MYKSTVKRRIFLWIGISLFCFIFFLIYDRFSHDVGSPYMTFLFAWPLILGCLPNIIIYIIFLMGSIKVRISKFTDNAYVSGIASVTSGSLLKGIFDIAGTSSVYQVWLMYMGVFLILTGFISWVWKIKA